MSNVLNLKSGMRVPRVGGPTAVILVALACLAAGAGCQSPAYEVHYGVRVTPAVVESDAPEDAPKTTEISADVTWTVTSHSLEALVTNRADSTATIIWEGATIAIDGGEPEPLLYTAPCPGPELPQPPTTVPRKGQVAIDTVPRSEAEWEWLPNRAMGGSWRAKEDIMGVPLADASSREAIETAAQQAVGKKLRIRLPILVGHRHITHMFELLVMDANVSRTYH
jgi:hypothetical protein